MTPSSVTTAPSLSDELFFVMARASAIGSADANRALASLDLKVRHYSALVLACGEEPLTQRELSQDLALDPSQIVAIVDTLEQRGCVERQPDPRDRRSKIVVATETGRELCSQARSVIDGATDQSLSALSSDERETLHALLSKVAFG